MGRAAQKSWRQGGLARSLSHPRSWDWGVGLTQPGVLLRFWEGPSLLVPGVQNILETCCRLPCPRPPSQAIASIEE